MILSSFTISKRMKCKSCSAFFISFFLKLWKTQSTKLWKPKCKRRFITAGKSLLRFRPKHLVNAYCTCKWINVLLRSLQKNSLPNLLFLPNLTHSFFFSSESQQRFTLHLHARRNEAAVSAMKSQKYGRRSRLINVHVGEGCSISKVSSVMQQSCKEDCHLFHSFSHSIFVCPFHLFLLR